jgi:putative SOS response-associated peptidase YedK
MFEVGKGELFAFAGLWDQWKNPKGEIIESCTILTMTPNALFADIHGRMPVIVTPGKYNLWLDRRSKTSRLCARSSSLMTRLRCGTIP